MSARAYLAAATLFAGLGGLTGAPSPAAADTSDFDFDLGHVSTQAHIAVSYGLTLTTATIARRYALPRWQAIALAAATTLVIGTAKELVDDTYSWGDQLANTIGISGAAIVVFSFRL